MVWSRRFRISLRRLWSAGSAIVCTGTSRGVVSAMAVDQGVLTEKRLQSYLDLRDELAGVSARRAERARTDNTKARWKSRSKEIKRYYKDRGHT